MTVVSDNSLFNQYSTQFLRGMSERMRDSCTSSQLNEFLKERFTFFREAIRRSGMVRVRKHKISQFSLTEKNHNRCVIVEIVSPDAPFIVVTVEALMRQLDLLILCKLHPIIGVELTEGKEVEKVFLPQQDLEKYDHLYLEVETEADNATLKHIETMIAGHMLAVQLVRNHHQYMLTNLESMIELIQTITVVSSETKNEWSKLCGWLKHDNYSVMGYIKFALKDSDTSEFINTIEDSGLGIISPVYLEKTTNNLFNVLTAHFWKRRHSEFPFSLDRIHFKSPVLRFEKMMMLSIRIPDEKLGMLEHVFLGLLRSSSLHVKNIETPLIHQKMQFIFKNRNMLVDSYDYNEVVRIFSATPKIELFRSSRKELMQVCENLLSINNPNNIHCFRINTRIPSVLKLMVVMPSSLFNEESVEHILALLKSKINHQSCDWFEARGSEKSRLHIEFELKEDAYGKSDVPALNMLQFESEISTQIKPWELQLLEFLRSKYPGTEGMQLYERYVPLMPSEYRARVDAQEALENIQYIEMLTHQDNIQFNLKRFTVPSILKSVSQLYIYSREKIHLIEIMPVLQNLGLHVIDQLTTRIGNDQKTLGFIQSFRVIHKDRVLIDEEHYKPLLEAIVKQVFQKRTENDPLNALALLANLDWREINVLQLYRNYYLQLNAPLTGETINMVLLRHPHCSRLLFETFYTQFSLDPSLGNQEYRQEVLLPEKKQQFIESLEKVKQVTDDEVLRSMYELIENTLRTNFYIPKEAEDTGISIKLDSGKISQMPDPVPFREIYVHDVGMQGLHLRFGAVARGGLRWSDRPDDFRTEILGLVKTQQTKNVVIVPVGSKGGFVLKNTPADREEAILKSKKHYRRFISAMLEITDNIDVQGKVQTPGHVITYDDPDPYLVVAPDKGTADFSDIANEVSEKSGFWLGDAFASGGSIGYDHRKEGITARGGWECVKLHFSEMGRNVQTDTTAVIGVGDMSGDVFGNGMLQSKTIQLKAAFNHMHIFLDPDPDPESSWHERKRLFEMQGSTWTDYSTNLISSGGGVYERQAKSIELSPEVKDLLGTDEENLKGIEVVRRILQMDVDLLWLGGIGTFIKSDSESDFQVGDQANNEVRINSSECRVKVIGEGANLGLTQLARIELSNNGVRLNTDSVDNSGGVNMSDYEVNLKILLQQMLRKGHIKSKQERDDLLISATDEISELVIANNCGQHRLISMDSIRSNLNFRLFRKLISHLEENGMNKRIEHIPSWSELNQLENADMPLPRPVLCVLMAYSKMEVFDALSSSEMPLEEELTKYYQEYLPWTVRDSFGENVIDHPLKKEIISTVLTNRITNQAGSTFISRMAHGSEQSIPDVVRTYLVIESSLEAETIREELYSLTDISEKERYEELIELEDVIKTLVRNVLNGQDLLPGFEQIEQFKALLQELLKHQEISRNEEKSDLVMPEADKAKEDEEITEEASSPSLDGIRASLHDLRIAPYVLHLCLNQDLEVSTAYQIAISVEQKFGFDWLREKLVLIEPQNDWELEYQDILLSTLDTGKLLLLDVLHASSKIDSRIIPDAAWLMESLEENYSSHLRSYFHALEQVRAGSLISLTAISVILSRLDFLKKITTTNLSDHSTLN